MALIKCSDCGAEISDKASSCIKCGCPITKSEPIHEEYVYCIHCGAKNYKGIVLCTSCNKTIIEGLIKYCKTCGTEVKNILLSNCESCGKSLKLISNNIISISGDGSKYDLILTDAGEDIINVFRFLHEETKKTFLTNTTPKTILENVDKETAESLAAKLIELGAKLEIQSVDLSPIDVGKKNEAVCKKCGSNSIQVIKKGFDSAGCCVGSACCGPFGALAGTIDSNKLSNVCLNCGNKWELKIKQSACMTLWNCHKLPERSFHINGKTMPMCARCLGVIGGLSISLGLLFMNAIPTFIVSVIFVSVIILDWGLQTYYGLLSNNIRRLITGILGGIGATSLLFYFVNIL